MPYTTVHSLVTATPPTDSVTRLYRRGVQCKLHEYEVCVPHLIERLGMLPVDVLLARNEKLKRVSQGRDH